MDQQTGRRRAELLRERDTPDPLLCHCSDRLVMVIVEGDHRLIERAILIASGVLIVGVGMDREQVATEADRLVGAVLIAGDESVQRRIEDPGTGLSGREPVTPANMDAGQSPLIDLVVGGHDADRRGKRVGIS
jgi:hypothetical protein